MTPRGGFVKENILAFESITTTIDAVVVGVLLHISTTILFEVQQVMSLTLENSLQS